MRRIFWGFCRNWFLHESLTLPFGPIRFWLRICGDIRIADSPHHRYGDSRTSDTVTPRIVESESRRLRVSPIRRVDDSAYR
jgi:hypothetical protein